jgi:putative ABC transport system ATP-binding protein
MINLQNILHTYAQEKPILKLDTFEAQANEHWLLLGKSGCGKTTLLHIIAGLLKPTKGQVHIKQQALYDLKPAQIDRFRARNIGIVLQKTHLMTTMNVMQNLEIAQYMAGLPIKRKRITDVLEQLQLSHRLKHYPSQLSGGEAQRLSVARAVLNEPAILLADEPTASLDDENAGKVITLLKTQAQQYNATLVIATHDQRVKDNFEKVLQL